MTVRESSGAGEARLFPRALVQLDRIPVGVFDQDLLTSTRLESVVRAGSAGLVIEQVVPVECGTPTIERRVISTSTHLGFSLGSCGD